MEPAGVRKRTSPRKVPSPAPIATARVGDTTAKNAGTKMKISSCPTPKGVSAKEVSPLATAYKAAVSAIATTYVVMDLSIFGAVIFCIRRERA
ncbi:MAG: hypothetical protein E6K89_00635 [Thaumarchaeota archaeon]|nr:MAG: hypothetical protein E6K89_00635 [Nitrososphaerota archaeon]